MCSYAPGIVDMVKGNLMPRPTLFGLRKLPDKWMHHLFRVRGEYPWEALVWLKENNPMFYGDTEIYPRRLSSLPVDGVLEEILSMSRHSDDMYLVERGNDPYIPGEGVHE